MWSTRIPDKCWLDAIAVRFYRIRGKFSPHLVFLGGKCLQEIGYYQNKVSSGVSRGEMSQTHKPEVGYYQTRDKVSSSVARGKCLQETWGWKWSVQRQCLIFLFPGEKGLKLINQTRDKASKWSLSDLYQIRPHPTMLMKRLWNSCNILSPHPKMRNILTCTC